MSKKQWNVNRVSKTVVTSPKHITGVISEDVEEKVTTLDNLKKCLPEGCYKVYGLVNGYAVDLWSLPLTNPKTTRIIGFTGRTELEAYSKGVSYLEEEKRKYENEY